MRKTCSVGDHSLRHQEADGWMGSCRTRVLLALNCIHQIIAILGHDRARLSSADSIELHVGSSAAGYGGTPTIFSQILNRNICEVSVCGRDSKERNTVNDCSMSGHQSCFERFSEWIRSHVRTRSPHSLLAPSARMIGVVRAVQVITGWRRLHVPSIPHVTQLTNHISPANQTALHSE
jgi:hypothetical protein